MAYEIERKFLLKSDAWRAEADAGIELRQGYLAADPACVVRVRLAGEQAFLTIKGAGEGIVRREYEYPLPVADAAEMLDHLCRPPLIEKRRHRLRRGAHVWEIDVFAGANEGLVLAEIELTRADEAFERPGWLGEEVSEDPRYYNARLIAHPYREWRP